ncbi:hypothetical protein [Arthrobacter cryoconiti]|uniref:Integral membrane protein n=1 Tax=Arthrobacter cryoconiti TaxID=748907 RepID=A0ABV8R2C1_9MICC|nr:hypothetical protein [Arthrobacter cryoconiti]MCC9069184.1 hypothetical protein [Arthrobacter cryoconiti]
MSTGEQPINIPDIPDPKTNTPLGSTHKVRVGTIVWGAVVVILGVLVILSRATGLSLPPGQTAMWLLFGAGVAMVVGGAIHLLTRR